MEKAAMMRAFKMMCLSNMPWTMSAKCKLSAVPLDGLKPIELREAYVFSQQMGQEICYEGRVLFAKISACTKAGKRLVICVAEAADGTATLLHIFNAVKSTAEQSEVEAMFPKGVKIAIKEPLCFGSIMHVSSPASVEFVGIAKKSKLKSVEDLRTEGNRLFSMGSFVLADLYYTECIKLSTAKEGVEKEKYVTVVSNRAETRLKLARYEEAVMDADHALKFDPHHVKSLCRKARGLCAIQEHEQALQCLELAVELSSKPVPQDLEDQLKKCKTFLRQSQRGEYDISGYLLGGLVKKLAPECSDFLGPVEVKLTSDGRGRGLYVTKDVKVGELLAVCNPAALSSGYEEADEDLFVEMIRACTASNRSLRQIYSMADAPDMTEIPDMKPFSCNVGEVVSATEPKVVDTAKIRRVKDRVAFTLTASDGSYLPGLWAIVALINHSCLPNASKVGIGNVVFIRAAKDLEAGEEVVFSYLEPLAPWAGYRKKIPERYGFDCTCRRCNIEKAYDKTFRDLPFVEDYPISDREEVIKASLALALDIENRIKKARNLTEEQKNWIRAGFADVYCSCMPAKANAKIPSHEQLLKALHDTAPGNPHTLSRMALISSRGSPSSSSSSIPELLLEEFAACYGKQSEEIVDAVIQEHKSRKSRRDLASVIV